MKTSEILAICATVFLVCLGIVLIIKSLDNSGPPEDWEDPKM